MTSTEAETAAGRDALSLEEWVEVAPTKRRRRPAPKANWFWRFFFPLVVLALGFLTFQLWKEGTKAVLDSTDGTLVEIVSDPEQPGFEAFVDPTPTMLLAHTDDGGLVGVTVLARTLLDNGGQAVLVSAELAADGRAGATLSERYATGGIDAVEADVGALFGFGFEEVQELSRSEFASFLALVEPLPYNLVDDLVQVGADGETELWLSGGGKQLDAEVAAQIYGFRNPAEVEVNRTERQLDMWESWFLLLGQANDINTVVPPFDVGLPAYLRAFAVGQSDISLLPVAPVDVTAEVPEYVLDANAREWLDDISDRMVPLPISPVGSGQPRVRLLDGTGDADTAEAALDALARTAEIVVVGNALEFGLSETTVSYHVESSAELAAEYAAQIGAVTIFDSRPDDPVDLTVVIGTDWEAP